MRPAARRSRGSPTLVRQAGALPGRAKPAEQQIRSGSHVKFTSRHFSLLCSALRQVPRQASQKKTLLTQSCIEIDTKFAQARFIIFWGPFWGRGQASPKKSISEAAM